MTATISKPTKRHPRPAPRRQLVIPEWAQFIALLLFILQFCNQVTEAVTGSAPNVTTTYTYDGANNRSTKAISGGATTTYSYNNLNQVTGYSVSGGGTSVSYGYDNNGNRTTRTISSTTDHYYYDYDNRLVQLVKNTSGGAGTYNYAYDYRTRRITRDESSVPTANGGSATVTHLVFGLTPKNWT